VNLRWPYFSPDYFSNNEGDGAPLGLRKAEKNKRKNERSSDTILDG